MSEMRKNYLFVKKQTWLLSFLLGLVWCFSAFAIGGGPQPLGQLKNEMPADTRGVGVTEHLGEKIDLSLTFKNEYDETVALSKYFSKDKPVFLVLAYYECPTLCNTLLNSLFETFKQFEWDLGEKWEFVVVSIDPEETPVQAKKKKDSYLEVYDRDSESVVSGVHFLTGEEKNIKALAEQVGFGYRKVPLSDEWSHAAVSFVLTPEGKISYYHYGLTVLPKVLRLSLVEASEYKIGNVVDRLILFCLQYDPNRKTYAFYAHNLMRVGGVLTVLIFAFVLFRFWRGQQSTKKLK